MQDIVSLFMAISFLIVGIACLHRTKAIQAWIFEFSQRAPAAEAWKGLFMWIQTPKFVIVTRILGIFAMLNFFLQVYIIMFVDIPVAPAQAW